MTPNLFGSQEALTGNEGELRTLKNLQSNVEYMVFQVSKVLQKKKEHGDAMKSVAYGEYQTMQSLPHSHRMKDG